MIRKSVHSLTEVENLFKHNVLYDVKTKENSKTEIDGDMINTFSDRYLTFFTKGYKCNCCGIEGKYFVKERYDNVKSYHLNLYALDENNKEVLMTKDHVIPKSKGGKNDIENYMTMCVVCNGKKADSIM